MVIQTVAGGRPRPGALVDEADEDLVSRLARALVKRVYYHREPSYDRSRSKGQACMGHGECKSNDCSRGRVRFYMELTNGELRKPTLNPSEFSSGVRLSIMNSKVPTLTRDSQGGRGATRDQIAAHHWMG